MRCHSSRFSRTSLCAFGIASNAVPTAEVMDIATTIQSAPANVRISPNEQYATFNGFAEVKRRAREEVSRPRGVWEPIGLGEASVSPRNLMRLLEVPECEHVREGWRTAIDRLANDHAGSITAGRSVLESACKHVLDEFSVPLDRHADLQQLYKMASQC